MNPFLRMLMGQQGGASTGGTFGGGPNADGTLSLTGDVPDNEIVVEAARNNSRQGGPLDGMSVPNDQAISNVQADIARGKEASDRRGMFGVKGTLRDVLGLVGDAFLVQGGRNPYYQPLRRQENISDAMAGFAENPQAAAERVAYYDPKMGQEILSDAENSLLRKAQADSLAAARQSQIEDRNFKQYLKAREMLGGLFNTPGAVQNGVISSAALRQAERIAGSAGMTLEEFMISEGMSEQDVRDYAAGTAKFVDQERLEDADTNIGISNRNADSRAISARASMIRAQRPPAGRAPAQPTEAAEVARIRGRLNRGETLSPGDKATWDKYTRPPSSGKSGRSFPGGKPPPTVSNW